MQTRSSTGRTHVNTPACIAKCTRSHSFEPNRVPPLHSFKLPTPGMKCPPALNLLKERQPTKERNRKKSTYSYLGAVGTCVSSLDLKGTHTHTAHSHTNKFSSKI